MGDCRRHLYSDNEIVVGGLQLGLATRQRALVSNHALATRQRALTAVVRKPTCGPQGPLDWPAKQILLERKLNTLMI